MSVELTILYAIATPFVGAGLIAATGSKENLREAVTLVTGAILFILVAGLYPSVAAGQTPSVTLFEMLPGLSIYFKIEPLGIIFAAIASFLWIVTSIYSIGYMRGHHEQNQTRFYVFFAIAISAAMGIAFAGNMLTLFVFYEILTLSTFPLVTHHGTEDAKRAGRIYLGILMGTSICFLLSAIIWTWSLTGTLDFTKGGILAGKTDGPVAAILLCLYVFGIGKAALMPFHRWLPAAMVAPTPVSALLHAVAVVKAGVFSVLKVAIYIFGTDFLFNVASSRWLLYLAAATVLIASLVAMTKDNLKARLAYSTISQLSYIVVGAMLASDLGVIGGGMHIAMHAFGKITLFFCAGAFLVAAHKTEISQMHGIGRTMPFTTLAFLIGSLSIIGLPPMGGLWSKWYLMLGALETGQITIVAVLVVSSLLNVVYLLQIPFNGFFSTSLKNSGSVPEHNHDADHDHSHDREQSQGIREAPVPCLIAIAISSIGCLVLFFYPGPVFDLMRLVVGS
ncbi:MAG: monovalent cation/H+ antiporter subunit D family protein [Rhodospirillales bacterium]|nr:monovalent cation/H+ antiporter subunit D family protein [Rhodospirillales bacterium]